MSEPVDQGERAADVAAWFVLERGSGVASLPAAVPLCREDCLTVARASLCAAGEHLHGSASRMGRFAAAVAGIPGLPNWLGQLPAAALAGDEEPLEAVLAAALVLPGEERSAGLAGRAALTAEAALLCETLRFAAAHAELRAGFDRAVADARIEAMRELAYGAGHEINNPLANIATRAQALLLEEVDPERRRRLSTIVDQSFRARDMIGGLMVFARPPKPRPEPVEVGGIAAAAIESVRGQAAARGIRLEYGPSPVPLSVVVDRVQIEEALRVVLVNALEAAAAGGRVIVRVSSEAGSEGHRCDVSVEDNGRGMPLEQVRRAFDPFYSGREAGRGAGMGLPKAWRLVESSGGDMVIDSRPGHGTRVMIRLPVHGAVAGPVPAVA